MDFEVDSPFKFLISRRLNGYSNEFWGWGGEDDDMYRRIRYHQLKIARYKPEIARLVLIVLYLKFARE